MKILFIRHSKTVFDKSHSNLVWNLSPEGIIAAETLAQAPLIANLDAIHCSFQTKALDTALILARKHFIPIIPNNGLAETTSVTNAFFEYFEEEMEKWHKGDYRINNGETKAESLLRFNKAIQDIAALSPNSKTIGVVSHANVLACFSEQYSDKDSFTIHSALKMPDIALFDFTTKTFNFTWGEKYD